MTIKFPITTDAEFETITAILMPDLFYIGYATPEGRQMYESLTERQRNDIYKVLKYHDLED